MKKYEFIIDERWRRKRLDALLFDQIRELSKMRLRDLMNGELCFVNGIAKDCGYKLETNDRVEVEVDTSEANSMLGEDIALDIIFEDEEMMVINKPGGMLVHPSFKVRRGTLMNAVTFYLNQKEGETFVRGGLVHRLDRKTSGLIIIAKNPRSHRILCDHFQRKLIEKRYAAIVEGIIENDEGEIIAPIGRFAEERSWKVKEDGKYAETKYKVIERREDTTLLELTPITGRTNQLRIHCEHIGHPILGDDWHSGREFARLCLHAWKLSLWHPNGERWLEFEAELPVEFSETN